MTLTQINKAGLDEIALDHVFTIGASGSSAYTFQGEGLNGTVNNPTLYLTRGKTYRFENGSGGHPIRIQSTSGASGTAYNTGVTNNAGSGTVIVEVQHDAPDVLYYQCTSHAAMNGILYITGALADGGVTTAKIATDAVTTAKIADQAVTLAKLPHGTSSNDGKFLRANNGADPTFETVSIPAGTTINNNADNKLITGSSTANTLEAEAKLTFNGSRLKLQSDSGEFLIESANGVDQFLVDSDNGNTFINGNLGIGTSSPVRQLDINNSSHATLALTSATQSSLFFADTDTNIGQISYVHGTNHMLFRVNDAERMRIDSSGRVGINDSSPVKTLDITGEGGGNGEINVTRTGGATCMIQAQAAIAVFGSSSNHNMQLKTNGTTALTIDTSQKVGIGISTPANKLHLYESSSGSNYIHFSNSSTGTSTSDGAQVGIDGNERLIVWQSENNDTRFATNNTERMRILAGGGLTFNGDTAAANALNDYEEGTFNATYYWSGSDANADGRYTKIGNRVFISVFEFAYSGAGLHDRDITYITGLPFNARSEPTSVGTIVRYSGGNNQTIGVSESCYIAQGGTQIRFDNTFNTGHGNWTLSLVYETDA